MNSDAKLLNRARPVDVQASLTQTMQISPTELTRLIRIGDGDIPLTAYVDGLMQAYARRVTVTNWSVNIIELNGQWRKAGSHGIFHEILRNLTPDEQEVWDELKLMRQAFHSMDLAKQELEVEYEGSFRDYES